jgi:hypothetical protein
LFGSAEAGGDSANDNGRDLFQTKYTASNVFDSIEMAKVLRDLSENYQNFETGKRVKALLDLNEHINRLFDGKLYYIAISKIPELESAVKACEFGSMLPFLKPNSMLQFLDDCKKEWEGLQEDYKAAAETSKVNTDFKKLYQEVKAKINNLVFDETTTGQIAELKKKVEEVLEGNQKNDDENDEAKCDYDVAWGQIKVEFDTSISSPSRRVATFNNKRNTGSSWSKAGSWPAGPLCHRRRRPGPPVWTPRPGNSCYGFGWNSHPAGRAAGPDCHFKADWTCFITQLTFFCWFAKVVPLMAVSAFVSTANAAFCFLA